MLKKGFCYRLALVRATLGSDPERRSWLVAEDFWDVPLQLQSINPHSPASRSLRRGGSGEGVVEPLLESFSEKLCGKNCFLLLTGFRD